MRLSDRAIASLAAGLCFALPCVMQAARADDGMAGCQADAMIVFDGSGSMSTTDYGHQTPRIAAVKEAMHRVLPEIEHLRRLGLVVYGEGAYNDCSSIALRLPPTANAAAPMLRIIEAINPRGTTPLTQSVRRAAEAMDYKSGLATVVLVTDGEETCGQDPCQMAMRLKKESPGLTIHVVGYRHSLDSYFAARCMAEATGGRFVSTHNQDELIKALRLVLGCPVLSGSFESQISQSACGEQ